MRSLAALLCTGHSTWGALTRWHRDAGARDAAPLRIVASRLELGDSIAGAVAALEPHMGAHATMLGAVMAIHARLGGDAPRMLAALAASLERRAQLESSVRAAAAGARASGRLVAGLPFLLLPLLPFSHAPLFDPLGVVIMSAGVLLSAAGLFSIEWLIPSASPPDDMAATVADIVAGVISGGVGLHVAMSSLATLGPPEVRAALHGAHGAVRLGSTWARALEERGSPELQCLVPVLEEARSLGLPVARALEMLSSRRRELQATEIERRLRRAPVLMVVPLAAFALPSFILLGIVPFLRGLAAGA